MKRLNIKVLLLCLATFIMATAVAWGVFEAVPHLEDEQANLFQAKVFAIGQVTVAAPPVPGSFFIPFVVNLNGRLFGKYTPGYPLALALGALIGQPWLVNALAAALGVLGAYLLGRDLFDPDTGLLAAALGAISPMFVLLSGTLLAHPTALAALVWFAWAFVRARRPQERHRYTFAMLAGGLMGWAAITRPWTAAAVGAPFILLALYDVVRSLGRALPRYLGMAVVFGLFLAILPLFNYVATGSPTTNTYQLWWPYDTIGFGPQIGRGPDGHTWDKAMLNFRLDFPLLGETLFGWPTVWGAALSWLPIALGLMWPPLSKREWGLAILPAALIAAHWLYWARGESLYGPRYYSEALPFLWIIGARGLIKFGSLTWPRRAIAIALPVLIGYSIFFTILPRFDKGRGFNNMTRHDIDVITAAGIHHAVIFVHADYWTDYGSLAWANPPNPGNGDLIFAQDFGPLVNAEVLKAYPDRKVYYYDRRQPIPLVAGR